MLEYILSGSQIGAVVLALIYVAYAGHRKTRVEQSKAGQSQERWKQVWPVTRIC